MLLLLGALAGASIPPTPQIALTQAGDEWRVHFVLDRPARSLHFELPYGSYRQRFWMPEDPAIRITANGELVRAERGDGRPFRSLGFRLTPRYTEVPRNYAPFSPFSEGGVLIYTGQFHACADRPCRAGRNWRFTVSAPGSQLLTRGTTHMGQASFLDGGDGTLVYAGTAKPVASPQVLAVIDPALDPGLRGKLDELLPKFASYFTGLFGSAGQRPMLFASLDRWPRPNSGLSYQGGSLPGQVFLHFYGSEWRAHADRADFVPWFFAHETAHFYHGARSGNAVTSEEDAWVHEGGAEAFAALAIREVGDRRYVGYRVGDSFDRCATALEKLGKKPLTASAAVGAFQNHYVCGLLIHLGIDFELRRSSNAAESLATLWAAFLDLTRKGAPWTGATYLRTARERGLSAEYVQRITDLTTKPQRLSGDQLRELLKL